MKDKTLKAKLAELLEAAGERGADSADFIRLEKQGFYVYYEGWIARPGVRAIRANVGVHNVFYINQRKVDDPVLLRAFQDGMRSVGCEPDEYMSVLSLDIKTYRLDEYEEDGKAAVRFYDPTNVGAFCKDAVIEAMR